jgi:hypothetical protein
MGHPSMVFLAVVYIYIGRSAENNEWVFEHVIVRKSPEYMLTYITADRDS